MMSRCICMERGVEAAIYVDSGHDLNEASEYMDGSGWAVCKSHGIGCFVANIVHSPRVLILTASFIHLSSLFVW